MKLRTLLLIGLPAVALAQVPQAPPLNELKTYLNLQDAQVQALQQLRQQQAQATQGIFAELASRQQTLRDQLDRGSTDATALGKLLLEIEALHKRLIQSRETFRTQAVNMLTAEQKVKLATLEQAQKLQPVVRQAQAAGLLPPPEVPPGAGIGPRGFGPGPGLMLHRPAAAPGVGLAPMRRIAPRGFSPQPR